MNIFISYRRDDSILAAKLIHDALTARFREPGDVVFMDIDNIGYGDDFVDVIDHHLDSADRVLVVIGPRWAEIIERRMRGDDWVRHEVARALQLRADSKGGQRAAERPVVLTVLVGGAPWPGAALPADIAELQRLSALKLDGKALKPSLNELVEAVQGQTFAEIASESQGLRLGERRARIAAVGLGGLLFFAAWLALFDALGIDTRVASTTMLLADLGRDPATRPWSGQVVLVGIDEGSERAVGRAFDPTWRAEHATVIEHAAAAGARSLAFDMQLVDPAPPAADAALERALKATLATMPVIFGVQELKGGQPAIPARFAALAHWGVACAGQKEGLARSLPLALWRAPLPAGERLPSLGLAAWSGGGIESWDELAQSVQVRLAREQRSPSVPWFSAETVRTPQGCELLDRGDRVALQLFDPLALPPLKQAPQRLAYEQVLRGDAAALAALRDRIVLVGTQFKGMDDFGVAGGSGVRWGVELFAAQIEGLVRGQTIRPLGALTQWLLTSAAALGGAALLLALRQRPAWLRGAALAAGALLLVVGAVLWYRSELQLIGLPYVLVAWAGGAWLGWRMARRSKA